MSKNKMKINTPPVIRVFLSSTFADMEHERSYFGEVLAPKLGRICSERGVSFFNVDLRWGITEEDQIGGQVLPICLGEIDKCRPYFIGIIGNRYGSVMERVPDRVAESIPWLEGKEGISITELEMLYAVLDHEKEDPSINSAFYMRSDRLSRELYPELVAENDAVIAKLDKLKSVIKADTGVLCSDYDTIEEFGEKVMRDLLRWLDENFPESGDVGEIRREWYNGEILRGHIENSEMNAFLDSYIESSRRSLLIYGDGARGKTACLTAWEPKSAKKILINCASDEAYRDWSTIAMRIMKELCSFLSDEDAKELRGIYETINNGCNGCILGEVDREKFRSAVLEYMRALEPECHIVVVINDLQLLSDESGRLLSWLPAEGSEKINFICTTNDGEMTENADVIGWNIKEMPLFSPERAHELISNSLRIYGKNLSPSQFDCLMNSTASGYPGQLKFVISFLLNHGRFSNLDKLASELAATPDLRGIYRYVFNYLTAEISERELCAVREVLGILRASNIALGENDCFTLAQSASVISPIEWARVCRIFEQFDLIHGDYWYTRDEETEKFVDELLSDGEMRAVHSRLASHIYAKLCDEIQNGKNASGSERAARSKQMIQSLRAAKDYEGLKTALCDAGVISSIMDYEPTVLRSAWLEIFLETDADVPAELVALAKSLSKVSEPLAVGICKMIYALDMTEAHEQACRAIGVDRSKAVDELLWANNLTKKGIEIYGNLNQLKKKRQFRELSDTVEELLGSSADEFNETELCKIYFFMADAEEHLGSYEKELATANEYCTLAIKAGYAEDMQIALRMRASALFRLKRENEALAIVGRIGKMAYDAGRARDYFSALNMTALCCYRLSRYDESIEIFDRLMKCWTKFGDQQELGTTLLNKCNAFYLNGKVKEALEAAERYYESVKNNRNMLSSIVSICGNIGIYATELELYDKAEKYLTDAIEISKLIGAEGTLANAYASMGTLYRKTDSFKKCIDLYSEQMEFHWHRREYEKVMEVYKKSFDWLSSSNHKNQAIEFEAKWKARFSEIEGGLDYFERESGRHAADAVTAEKLLEQAKMAASAGDLHGEADAYIKISEVCKKDDPALAAQYLIHAAMIYTRLDDRDMRIEVLESALQMLFNEGQIVDVPTFDTAISVADDENIEAIARIWRQLGNLAKDSHIEEEGKEDGVEFNSLIEELLRHREKNEYLAVCCLFDLASYLAKELPKDALLSLISCISDNYRQDMIDRFDSVMSNEMNIDLNYLMNNYFGSRADMLIERYEKYTHVLNELKGLNAPAIAGNLALIYRRRKEKEKAFEYHNLSAELFRRAGKMNDCFIEIMNGATARKELSSPAEAIEILRAGLQEALEVSNRKYAAMIAGNLASVLMMDLKQENCAEIENCFTIEEEYFRESGYWRDLVISLINQSIYHIKNGAPVSRWSEKTREARVLAAEAKLSEFNSTLSQLEWRIAQAEHGNNSSEESVRESVAEVFDKSGYGIRSFERRDGYYYIVADPKQQNELYAEAVVAAAPFNKDCCLRVIALMEPEAYREESESLEQYIEWWNKFDKYTLTLEKDEKRIKAVIDLQASDWKQLSERFRYFTALWEADKMNCYALMLGIVDLDSCRQAKLKALEA